MVPLIGASASAAGLLAGLLVGRPPRVLPFVFMAPAGARAAAMRFEIPLKALVWVWVGLEALTFLEPSAHPSATPAHLGGLLAGGLLATAMGRRQSP